MHEPRIYKIEEHLNRLPKRTPIIIPRSGQSTEESNSPAAPSDSGQEVEQAIAALTQAMADDPYWGICLELWRLLSRKRGDYGCVEHPLQNALGVADDGICPWGYQIARIGEKCRRLRGSLTTMGIRETIMDIAGHAVVGVACLDHLYPWHKITPQKKENEQ